MSRILICEDDANFRLSLKVVLQKDGHTITEAEDGRSAQDILALQPHDLIISDIRMPRMNGIELLHWVKRNQPTPMILMTGFSELTETQEAFDLGAKAFLPKPFDMADLRAALTNLLGSGGLPEAAPEAKAGPAEYEPIAIDDFVSGRLIPFNIYIRLSETNYIKLAQQGEDLSLDRIKTYKGKGVTKLYLTHQDFLKYLGMNLSITKAIQSSDRVAVERKQQFMRHVGEIIVQKLWNDDLDKETFDESTQFLQAAVSVLTDDLEVLKLLEVLKGHSDVLYAHSLAVSMYGVIIAKNMGLVSPPTQFKLSAGGFFHDIGKREIHRNILDKFKIELTPNEIAMLDNHPIRGMELLSGIRSIPSDVIQIVLQHHENCLGYGFPKRLRKNAIHPLARLIYVADLFCNYVLPQIPGEPGLTAQNAIARIDELHKANCDNDVLKGLKKAFHYVDPEGPNDAESPGSKKSG